MNLKEKKILLLFLFLFPILSSCSSDPPASNGVYESQKTVISPTVTSGKIYVDSSSEKLESSSKQAQRLYIDNLSSQIDENEIIHIFGLVHNISDSSVNDIEIVLKLYDDDGNVLEMVKTSPFLSNLKPDKSSPFSIVLKGNHQKIGRITAGIENYQLSNIEAPDIKISRESMSIGLDQSIYLSGEIQNNNYEPIIIDSIAAGLFDKNQYLISASEDSESIYYLDPGEISPFQITFPKIIPSKSPITEFQIYIEAHKSAPKSNFDLLLGNISTGHSNNPTTFQLSGEITNKTNQALMVSLIAGIYDKQGYLLDVSRTTLPIPISTGETLPFHFMDWKVINNNNDYIERASRYSVQWEPYSTRPNNSRYVHLMTFPEEIIHQTPNITLVGKVFNDTEFLLKDIVIFGTLYDKNSGKILATNHMILDQIIHQGQTVDYQFVYNLNERFQQYEIIGATIAKGKIVLIQE